MPREQPSTGRIARASHRASESNTSEAWTIPSGDADFALQLANHPRARDWSTLHGYGRREILRQKRLGLVCSVQCPGSVVIKTFDAIRELRDAGIIVAGGFHSPMEQECLEFLLRGEQPVIICPARHPVGSRLPVVWRTGLEAGRLLLLSPFGAEARRTTKSQAQSRNEFVAAISAAVLIPHASPGGNAEAIARKIIWRGQPLFTVVDEANDRLLSGGASKYDLNEIRRHLALDDSDDR